MKHIVKRIVYPGTFDPITRGHEDLVRRAADIFDEVIVAVAASPGKAPMFDLAERETMAREALSALPNVRVMGFSGLLINLVQTLQTRLVLRGLRAVSDFEFEFQLAGMNRAMMPGLDTVFLTPDERYMFVSASMVREIARLSGDVTPFVSPLIASRISAKLARPE